MHRETPPALVPRPEGRSRVRRACPRSAAAERPALGPVGRLCASAVLASPGAAAGQAASRTRTGSAPRVEGLLAALVLAAALVVASPGFSTAGAWDEYSELLDRRAAEAEGYNIWGNTFLPPAGMWTFQYKYNMVDADSRYDAKGNKGPILAPLNIFGGSLDFNPTGSAQAHKLTFLCGLGKQWAFAIDMQMGTLDLNFDVQYDTPQSLTAKLAAAIISGLFGTQPFNQSLEGLWETIELLGHPRPVLEMKDQSLKLGDLGVAVGCNYLRNDRFSLLGAFKVTFPTGHIAEPNSALIFALGPDIDVGVGSYGFELGHLADYRFPKPLDWIIIASELYYDFYTEQSRESPTVFTKPNPEVVSLLKLAGTDVGPYFPDLSNMEPEYHYLPGSKVRGVLQVLPTLFGILPLSLGVQANYTNASVITTSTPEFNQYVDAVGLVADSWSVEGWAKVTLGLFPLKLPITLAVGYNKSIAGKNAIIYDNNWEFTFQFFSPWFFGEQILSLTNREKKKD
jgi:hypothetical protein